MKSCSCLSREMLLRLKILCAWKIFWSSKFELWALVSRAKRLGFCGHIYIYPNLRVCGAPNTYIFGNECTHKKIIPHPTLYNNSYTYCQPKTRQTFKSFSMPKHNNVASCVLGYWIIISWKKNTCYFVTSVSVLFIESSSLSFVAKGQTTEDARSNARSPQHETTGAGEIYKHR